VAIDAFVRNDPVAEIRDRGFLQSHPEDAESLETQGPGSEAPGIRGGISESDEDGKASVRLGLKSPSSEALPSGSTTADSQRGPSKRRWSLMRKIYVRTALLMSSAAALLLAGGALKWK